MQRALRQLRAFVPRRPLVLLILLLLVLGTTWLTIQSDVAGSVESVPTPQGDPVTRSNNTNLQNELFVDPNKYYFGYVLINCTNNQINTFKADWVVPSAITSANCAPPKNFSVFILIESSDLVSHLRVATFWTGSQWDIQIEEFNRTATGGNNIHPVFSNIAPGTNMRATITRVSPNYSFDVKNLDTGAANVTLIPNPKTPAGALKNLSIAIAGAEAVNELNPFPCACVPPSNVVTFASVLLEREGASGNEAVDLVSKGVTGTKRADCSTTSSFNSTSMTLSWVSTFLPKNNGKATLLSKNNGKEDLRR